MKRTACSIVALLGACTPAVDPIRIATFNTSLNRDTSGGLIADLEAGDAQARKIAAVLQRVRPDIVLLAEFDHDDAGRAAALFVERYLTVAQADGLEPISYPHRFSAPVNTGEPSGLDLDGDGASDGPGDAWGFGRHPGQYGMLVLSRFEIDQNAARTFRELRWASMPENSMPAGYWPDATMAALRLSSKSHWDVPIRVTADRTLHLLASHPTPPVFDGPEDRNGRRNHDEIRFWRDYLTPGADRWIVDDRGSVGGLAADASFVIVGDLNADPADGDSYQHAITLLLDHPRVAAERAPESLGAATTAGDQGGANTTHRTPALQDTGDFRDVPGPGNLRLDYVLPSRDLPVLDAQVFWPIPGEPGAEWLDASDHRLVFIDVGDRDGG